MRPNTANQLMIQAEGVLEQSPVVTIKSMCDALRCLQDISTRIQNANHHNRRPDMLLCRCLTEGCFAEFRIPCTGRQTLSRGTIMLMCEEASELVWDGSDLSLFVPHYAKKAAKLVEECRKTRGQAALTYGGELLNNLSCSLK